MNCILPLISGYCFIYTRGYNVLALLCWTRLNIILPFSFQDLQKHVERTRSAERNFEELLASLLEEVKPMRGAVFCQYFVSENGKGKYRIKEFKLASLQSIKEIDIIEAVKIKCIFASHEKLK